ncbi:hypothetical protein [Kitasatospora sp. NPDC057500]|uniref:hypothetical protein n=1 Tax=Kitasatospora sp. NPDC057500 TaxID=3346151 RepID=UPI0036B49443
MNHTTETHGRAPEAFTQLLPHIDAARRPTELQAARGDVEAALTVHRQAAGPAFQDPNSTFGLAGSWPGTAGAARRSR